MYSVSRVSLCRYGSIGINTYKVNLEVLFETLHRVLNPRTLVVWLTTLPISEDVRGGVILNNDIKVLSATLRLDVLISNNLAAEVGVCLCV